MPMPTESESMTVGPICVEVTVVVRLYAKSQAHAVLEVDERLTQSKDANALHIIKTETKVVAVS